MLSVSKNVSAPTLIRSIFVSSLIVGTLDITAAIIQVLLKNRNPMMMLKFIASGVVGKVAFSGGIGYSLIGLFLHYVIATIWTAVFFALYCNTGLNRVNKVVVGFCYGLFVWCVMSFVVLPLSFTPAFPFNAKEAVISAAIVIVAVGLPMAYLAHRMMVPAHKSLDR